MHKELEISLMNSLKDKGRCLQYKERTQNHKRSQVEKQE